jgi:hypothetical protein
MTEIDFQTRKPLGLNLNHEMATLLLKGIDVLPENDRRTVTYSKLRKDLEYIIQIWERRIKNEKIVQEQRRTIHKAKKAQKKETKLS